MAVSEVTGRITKRTDKGGIFVETTVNGVQKAAWFGAKIVKTTDDGVDFIPENAAEKKIGVKVRIVLSAPAESAPGKPPAPTADEQKGGKTSLMRRCIRAAKKLVDEELCCDLAIEPVDFTKLRVDAILRIANSFYIDETKNNRMARIK